MGYRMIEGAGAKTSSRSTEARLTCFLHSAAFYNAWVTFNAQADGGGEWGGRPAVPMAASCAVMARGLGPAIPPEPPPAVLP